MLASGFAHSLFALPPVPLWRACENLALASEDLPNFSFVGPVRRVFVAGRSHNSVRPPLLAP